MPSRRGAVLEEVFVRGFKSIDAEITLKVAQPRGITVFTGPNGCGKTSILEAISCALTYDVKELRATTLLDLLHHNGMKVSESADVSLVFAMSETIKRTLGCHIVGEGRQFKIDGRKKTMQEVRTFLKEVGLDVEDPSFRLQQGTVTQLPFRSSKSLAMAITRASGAKDLHESISRSRQEIARWEEVETRIETDIGWLKETIQKQREDLTLLTRIQELESTISRSERALSFSRCKAQIQIMEGHQNELTTTYEELSDVQGRVEDLEALVQIAEQKRVDFYTASDGHLRLLREEETSLSAELVALEEEERLVWLTIHEQDERQYSLRNHVTTLHQQVVTMDTELDDIESEHQSLLCERSRLEEDLNHTLREVRRQEGAIQDGREINYQREELKNELQNEEAILKRNKGVTKRIEQEIQSLEQDISGKEGLMKTIQDEVAHLQSLSSPERIQRDMDQMEEKIQQLLSRRHDLLWNLKNCTRTTSLEPAGGDYGPILSLLDLIPSALEYVHALGILCQSDAGVHVAETTNAALSIIKDAKKRKKRIRVWPLDRIRPISPNIEAQQRAIQASLPVGTVVHPLDCVQCDSRFRPILQKIFGKWLIVCDDATAIQIVTMHRLSCITIKGTQHRPGNVSGGYRGHQPTLFETKCQISLLQEELNDIETDIDHLQRKLQHMHKDAHAQRRLPELIARRDTLYRDQIHFNKSKREEKIVTLRHAREEYERHTQRVRDIQSTLKAMEGRDSLIPFVEGLKTHVQEIQRCLDDLNGLGSGVDEILEKKARLSTEKDEKKEILSDLNEQLRTSNDHVQSEQKRVEELQHTREERTTSLRTIQAKIRQERTNMRQIEEEAQEYTNAVRVKQNALVKLKKRASFLEKHSEALKNSISSLGSEIDAVLCSMTGPIRELVEREERSESAIELDLRHMQRELMHLRKMKITVKDPSEVESKCHILLGLEEKMKSIQRAVAQLRAGIHASQDMILQANETIFLAVRTFFAGFFHRLVPTKYADIEKVDEGGRVESGIAFRISRSPEGPWKTHNELSGGQQTLLALSFVLAVARCRKSAFYIMDEVDAALDEENQKAVALLIQDEFCDSQVLSVSHHPEFQHIGTRTIQIGKEGSSSHVTRVLCRR